MSTYETYAAVVAQLRQIRAMLEQAPHTLQGALSICDQLLAVVTQLRDHAESEEILIRSTGRRASFPRPFSQDDVCERCGAKGEGRPVWVDQANGLYEIVCNKCDQA